METINQKDTYEYTPTRIVLTGEQLFIPGIRSFGRQNNFSARPPLPNHFHENALELTFITDGIFTFHINHTNYGLHGGELFIAYPNEIHSTSSFPMSVGELYWIQIDLTTLTNFLFLSSEAAKHLLNRFTRSKRYVMTFEKSIKSLLVRAFSAALGHDENSRFLCAACIVTILNLLCLENSEISPSMTPDIENALFYINSNLCSEISLEDLASGAGLSLSQFKQKFRRETGSSPRAYINRQKIEFSKELLLQGMPITDIAMKLCFNTSTYFSSVFRKYTTYSPSEFIFLSNKRLQNKAEDV